MSGILLWLVGCMFYPALNICIRKILQYRLEPVLSMCDRYFIAEKTVNAIQGVLSTAVGAVIAGNCHGNIMLDRHWLTNSFCWFGFPYFLYDIWAMYNTHHLLNSPAFKSLAQQARLKHFLRNNIMMMIHHIVLPLIFFPAILYFRNDKGDYFVGIFYMCEAALPFIAIRFILAQLKLKDTVAYIFFGILMIVMFFITRILLFPFLYWKYSQFSGTPFLEVPFNIPVKCSAGCLAILVIQVWILYLMILGAFKVFYKIYMKNKSKAD